MPDPSASGEDSPPVGRVTAARAGNGETGDEICDGNKRCQQRQHHGLWHFKVDRHEEYDIEHDQPQDDDDHTKPGQRVWHPHQRLRPGEKRRAEQRRPDQRHVYSGRPRPEKPRCKPQRRHRQRAIQHRPSHQCGVRHRKREHPGGKDRRACGQVTCNAEAEHPQETHECRAQGHDHHEPKAELVIEGEALSRL